MPDSGRETAILFVDISGSTRLYEMLGDARALAEVERCIALLVRATAAHGGRVVKTTGDGLMAAFGAAADALESARAMQTGVEQSATPGAQSLAIHAGCHIGPVIESAGDLYGDAVNTAARVAGLAKVGQVLVTEAVAMALPADLRPRVRPLDRIPVKGKSQALPILEFLWRDAEDLTLLGTRFGEERGARLLLRYGELELRLDGEGPEAIVLGREAGCDIVVDDRRASRQHARIERRRNKFVLVDHSSNGTMVRIAELGDLLLRREEFILRARGWIGFGTSASRDEAALVEFVCE